MSGWVLAIDPGSTDSAYVVIDAATYRPRTLGKIDNRELVDDLSFLSLGATVAIEQIGHYGTGMPAGKTVFDTCVWIGQFARSCYLAGYPAHLVLRAAVKTHLCGQAKAKDPNVVQALVDRFASDAPNRGKGTKAEPGFFYGFHSDIWQAFALAVYVADGGLS